MSLEQTFLLAHSHTRVWQMALDKQQGMQWQPLRMPRLIQRRTQSGEVFALSS